MPRGQPPPSPLPQIDGVDAVRVRLPGAPDGATPQWSTIVDYLCAHFPMADDDIREAVASGAYVDNMGSPITLTSPYRIGYVWTRRAFPDETPHPEPLIMLHRDDNIVVFDKPHDMAVSPQGRHVRHTALALARVQLHMPELSLAHRLDRGTAGVLLMTTRPEVRGAYQELFATGNVRKTYLAMVHAHDGVTHLPSERISHLVKHRDSLQVVEVRDAAPNARTELTVIDHWPDNDRALVHLTPLTGKTHQIRVHLAALGVPIVNDVLYPTVRFRRDEPIRFDQPLQLLAESIEFDDPLSGELRRFSTCRRLM